jgi:hypothetical protein
VAIPQGLHLLHQITGSNECGRSFLEDNSSSVDTFAPQLVLSMSHETVEQRHQISPVSRQLIVAAHFHQSQGEVNGINLPNIALAN